MRGFSLLYYDPVAAGFSLRLFAQLKSCGYQTPWCNLKLTATLIFCAAATFMKSL